MNLEKAEKQRDEECLHVLHNSTSSGKQINKNIEWAARRRLGLHVPRGWKTNENPKATLENFVQDS